MTHTYSTLLKYSRKKLCLLSGLVCFSEYVIFTCIKVRCENIDRNLDQNEKNKTRYWYILAQLKWKSLANKSIKSKVYVNCIVHFTTITVCEEIVQMIFSFFFLYDTDRYKE